MTPEVLIVAAQYDFSCDLVALELERRGIPYFRLNKEQLPLASVIMSPSERVLRIKSGDIDVTVSRSLRSVYFRQPVFLRNTPDRPLSPKDQLSRTQWSAFVRSLSVFADSVWVNWPQSTYLAECKPYQLGCASDLGFSVPNTAVTNDMNVEATKTYGDSVLKSLDTALIIEGEDCLFAYTNDLIGQQINASAAFEAPFIIQERIHPKSDIRVTVVGSKVFSVRILVDGLPFRGDWRLAPRESVSYEPIELPQPVTEKCVNLLQLLGLRFGAIDLLESNGLFHFLEINPTGEWAWIQARPHDICSAIVDELSPS